MFTYIGYKTYIGFLYLEYTYNNPVVNVFVKLLSSDVMNENGFFRFRNLQFDLREESLFGESGKSSQLRLGGKSVNPSIGF